MTTAPPSLKSLPLAAWEDRHQPVQAFPEGSCLLVLLQHGGLVLREVAAAAAQLLFRICLRGLARDTREKTLSLQKHVPDATGSLACSPPHLAGSLLTGGAFVSLFLSARGQEPLFLFVECDTLLF